MQLVADRDYLLEWGSTAYDALLVKEDEVSELTQQLEMTSEILESTRLAFEESQCRLAEVTMELERLQSLPDSVQSQVVMSGDSRMSMVEIVRDSGDGDASILDTSIGISRSLPLGTGSVELGVAVDCCGIPDMVVVSTTDGMETGDVVPGIMFDVDESVVGLDPVCDTTPLEVSSEVVAGSGLVSDQLQLVSSGLQSEPLTEIGAFYRPYTVRYAHQFTFDSHVDDMMIRRCILGSSACHQLWDGLTPWDESCDRHGMVIGYASDSWMIHDQEIGGDIDVVDDSAVVHDFTPLAMSFSHLVNDQSQLVALCLQDELVGSFYWHYISGYVHRLAFDSCIEELMASRFGLSYCYPSCDAYSPSAVYGSYGDVSMAGDLQRYVDYSWCTVSGFSALGAVSFRSVHDCCRVRVCFPHSTVRCVDSVYLDSDMFRVGVTWGSYYGSCYLGFQLSSIGQFDYGFLLIIFQRILQELALIDSSLDHDYIWDPGGLIGYLFSYCLGTSNFRKGGLSCPLFQ